MRNGGSIAGIALILMAVLVYPVAQPVVTSFVTDALALTTVSSGLDYIIISTVPYWGLAAAFMIALWLIFSSRRNRM